MVEKEFVLHMARYNTWQNNQLRKIVQAMDDGELKADRCAFFGSIFNTLNHLLWGDTIWMSRWYSDIATPKTSIAESISMTPTIGAWDAERFRMDGRIRIWAQTLSNVDLRQDISWFSGAIQQDVTKPMGLCVAHMFNHQTHHRGQISQMLSAAGITPPVSDLVFMPEDV
ncbi:DinB family protein [Sulfitobacter donghicola DSW-25 = KCTC 12864 = JCM 14565]|uniref:DNA damage-inducible protein DinB n=2 Tax=Sulfitobacter TaxID=60136 RepID=A0A073IEU0_9RHOB|nr:DNA damage-inducible protein DinB [Sulfitobacter donghicola DSW-25 = KCTC 12864 = JCM 14565]KIN69507.1 DinB family protein [Sulfitobacter donghicola DSW-25 = KCTC 12864 = JCM 14565]